MNEHSASVVGTERRKKDFAIRAFGGKCQKCGYDKCQGALEFHHLDAKTKDHRPSYIIARWSWERARPELEKCILLCSNCHREEQYLPNGNADLVLLKKPFVTVECEQCHIKFDTKVDDAKYCSRTCRELASRKVVRPNKQELARLLAEGIAWIRLGQMFGVSDSAVRKWARSYGLIV